MFVELNLNPLGKRVGDCAVRAIATVEDVSWYEAFDYLCGYGRELCEMPNANSVIGAFLKDRGYSRHVIENTCPACYTIGDFANDHPKGIFVVGTGTHVVAVIDGCVYDSWDSTQEIPQFFWRFD